MISMQRKICALLVACIALPLSVFATSTTNADIVVNNGIKTMSIQEPCGSG